MKSTDDRCVEAIKTSLKGFISTLPVPLYRFLAFSRRFISSGAVIPTALVIGGVLLNTIFTVTPAATKAVLGGPTDEFTPRPTLSEASLMASFIETEDVLDADSHDNVIYPEDSADSLIAQGLPTAPLPVTPTPSRATASASRAKILTIPAEYIMPILGQIKVSELHGSDHPGVDIPKPKGTPVVAAANGYVTESTIGLWNGGYGGKVMIKHANGIYTVYAHLSASAVTVGEPVKQGETIGYVGNTGRSTGNHLHFEVRRP